MAVLNSALLDSKHGIFSVLDLVSIRLGRSDLVWQSCDLEDEAGKGACFSAYSREEVLGGCQNPVSIGEVLVTDSTGDPDEPDILKMEESDLLRVDANLRAGHAALYSANGIKLVEWTRSSLYVSNATKSLVTAYITSSAEHERQFVAVRFHAKGRKIVAIAGFDLPEIESQAALIQSALLTLSISDGRRQVTGHGSIPATVLPDGDGTRREPCVVIGTSSDGASRTILNALSGRMRNQSELWRLADQTTFQRAPKRIEVVKVERKFKEEAHRVTVWVIFDEIRVAGAWR